MPQLAITVLGHDRPGIIAAVTSALAEHGGNIEDSSMTLLRGHFAMTLIVSTEASSSEIERVLVERLPVDLLVAVRAVPPELDSGPVGDAYVVTVHGGDRAGIVAGVTQVLADVGGNITDLTTRLTGSLYVVVAEVELPSSVDVPALSDALTARAHELGVEATLRPAETDVL
ncbi:MAG: ACT domain-containing protein [Candidatus Nanopelagicales bacterium]